MSVNDATGSTAVESCKEAARLMSRKQDIPLSDAESESLKQHLFTCLSCRRFDEQLVFLRKLARQYADGGAA